MAKLTKKLFKNTLNQYEKMYSIEDGKIKANAEFGIYIINCGMNCSQYTLKTKFNYNVLDMLDNEDVVMYAISHNNTHKSLDFLFASPNSLPIGAKVKTLDNDTNRTFPAWNGYVTDCITSSDEYREYLKENGYQVNPPRAFKKALNEVRNACIGSIKGVYDLENFIQEFPELKEFV